MRRALLVAVLCLAGCGGGQRAPAVADPTRRRRAARSRTKIAGTDLSAQEVADAAAGAPVNGASAPRAAAAAGTRLRAPDRALPRLQRAPGGGDGDAGARARARAARRRPRAPHGARGPAPTSAICGSARPTARSATSTPRSPPTAAARARAVDAASRSPALRAGRGAARSATCGTLRRTVPEVEITPLDYAIRAHEILEDAQRDMLSGAAAPYSGAGVLRDRGVAGGHRGRRRHAAPAARRARRARADRDRPAAAAPRARGDPARPRRELAGARRAHPAPSASASTAASAPASRCSPGVPHALETQLPPAIPALRP